MRKSLLILSLGVLSMLGACETDPSSDQPRPTEPEDTLGVVSFATDALPYEMHKGDAPLEIEVTATKTNTVDRTFGVEVVTSATTAEAEAYELPAATITIPAGERSGKFVVKPVYKYLTPDAVTLTLRLTADAPLIGDNAQVVVSLKRYYKLDMAFLTQPWAAENYRNEKPVTGSFGSPYEITIREGDKPNHVFIPNLFDADSDKEIEAVVDFEKSQLTIETGQLVFTYNGSNMHIYKVEEDSPLENGSIICPITYQGITIDKYSLYSGGSIQPWYPCKTTLTEKE